MSWSPQQEAALSKVADWLKDGEDQQVYRLFGYAGTGKTTLAKHLAEGVGGEVHFAAFTGKAAHVLSQKGCPASTIHSLIYHTRDKGQAKLKELEQGLVGLRKQLSTEGLVEPAISSHRRVQDLKLQIEDERRNLARPAFTLNSDSIVKDASLIVIDECSMVDEQLGADLLSFGTRVLVLGDPAQLPPVRGAGFFTEGHKPDSMLEEIHRQARDNPILWLADQVRRGERLAKDDHGAAKVIRKSDFDPAEALEADQLLVGKNATRRGYNNRMRSLLGRGPGKLPVGGDKVVCLRNDHEMGLLNGALFEVDGVASADEDEVYMTVEPEHGGPGIEVCAHSHHFLGKENELSWWDKKSAQEFDYGYALTCHKSQGSQWDHVVVFDESYCFRQDRYKWLYTAITRAAQKLTVVDV